jgi:DNA-binding GntR family transcriptional regulator
MLKLRGADAVEKSGRQHGGHRHGRRVFQGTLELVLLQSSLIVSLYGGGLMSSCSVEEHQAIVDAIEEGDAARASHLMNGHLTHLEGTLRLEVEDHGAPDLAAIFQ